MSHIIHEFRGRRLRGTRRAPVRDAVPRVQLPETSAWIGGQVFLVVSIVTTVVTYIILSWMNANDVLDRAVVKGLVFGFIVTGVYYLAPLLRVLIHVLWYGQRPSRQVLDNFTRGQKFACLCFFSFGLLYSFDHLFPTLLYLWHHHHLPSHEFSTHPYLSNSWHFLVIGAVIAVVLSFFVPLLLPKQPLPRKTRFKADFSAVSSSIDAKTFGLWLGRSTGLLASLYHRTGVASRQEMVLSLDDAAQNILVLGGIGSGKTTRVMQPLLAQLLDQDCGGLLFDVKGDVKHAAIQITEMTNRQIQLIGVRQTPLNLLAGLSPEIAASFLKSAFLLGGTSNHEAFWVDTATELCRNTLGILSFLPEQYSLQGLYQYLFHIEQCLKINHELEQLFAALNDKERRLLDSYWHYQTNVFDKFDEKVKAGVHATIAQVLSPFNHPDLIDAFCQHSQNNLSLQSVLDGAVFLVDMPLARWGLGAKVVYTFIKLRFFNVMQSRNQQPNLNQTRPAFFMCDEYQELVSSNKDGLSDLNFWDKSRSSKTIGIISAQSISSFYAALGNRDVTHALLQNFRQKLCFRTEDTATLTLMDTLAGRAKVMRQTKGHTKGDSTSGWANSSTHQSDSHSVTEVREAVLDATLFRNLEPNQAVALLSIKGQSMDDVMEMLPLYVD